MKTIIIIKLIFWNLINISYKSKILMYLFIKYKAECKQ